MRPLEVPFEDDNSDEMACVLGTKTVLHTNCEKAGYGLCSDRGNIQMVSDGFEQVRLPIYRVREVERKVRQVLDGLRGEHFQGAQLLCRRKACSERSETVGGHGPR